MHLYYTQIEPLALPLLSSLRAKGWQPHHLGFRQVVYHHCSVDLHAYAALIITSKHAAQWLLATCPNSQTRLAVVGQKTASLLPQSLLLFPEAPADSEALVKCLHGYLPSRSRLLFLRGEQAHASYAQELTDYEVEEVVVYSTIKKNEKYPPLLNPNMVYFQAPSTVADYQEVYRTPPDRIGAIGTTTAKAVVAAGWSVTYQPPRPENDVFVTHIPLPHDLGLAPKPNGDAPHE